MSYEVNNAEEISPLSRISLINSIEWRSMHISKKWIEIGMCEKVKRNSKNEEEEKAKAKA